MEATTAKLVKVVTLHEDGSQKIETVCTGLRNIFDTMGTMANLPKMLTVTSMAANDDLDLTVNEEEVEQIAPTEAKKAEEESNKAVKASEASETSEILEKEKELDESEIFPEETEGNSEELLDILFNFDTAEKQSVTTKKGHMKIMFGNKEAVEKDLAIVQMEVDATSMTKAVKTTDNKLKKQKVAMTMAEIEQKMFTVKEERQRKEADLQKTADEMKKLEAERTKICLEKKRRRDEETRKEQAEREVQMRREMHRRLDREEKTLKKRAICFSLPAEKPIIQDWEKFLKSTI